MQCTCIRQTDLPGASRLFADLVYHPDRTAKFFSLPPTLREAAEQVQMSPERRAALVEALREINGNNPLLEELAKPGTVAVVTGQQVGLFSGPAYTLYKALTAVKLARQLTADGVPAVPVFWIATEDHDFAEINHAYVFNSKNAPARLEIEAHGESNQPVGEVPLTDIPLEVLRTALSGHPFADDVVSLVGACYQSGRTFGQGFSALLKELLRSYGVLQIDPMRRSIRDLAVPMIQKALDQAPELGQQLIQRNKELEKAGYHAQVHVEPHTSLFFLLENGKRLALRRQGDDYATQGRHFRTEELKERAHEISPNALLRPVIQDSMLPTVAYIGGPAELSYFAQSNVLYRELLGRQPLALHRSGFTLLDSHSSKMFGRYGLELPSFFHGEHALKEKMSRTLVSPSVSASVEKAKTSTTHTLAHLKAELIGFDPTLAKALDRSVRKMEYQLAKMERKIARETMARDHKAAQDAESLYNLVFPHRRLQERFYSILPFLARHGFGLVDEIYEQVHLDCPDHQLLVA